MSTADAAPDADAFYLPLDGGRFAATEHTAGPWDPALQHAGPPAALLVRAVEELAAPWPAVLARVSVDILGPIPVAEVEVAAAVRRSGRSVELVTAELAAGGRVAARTTVWRIRRQDLDLPASASALLDAGPAPALPAAESPLPAGWSGAGYLRAIEWRVVRGSWGEPGPATVWGRQRVALVVGEEPSAVQRVLTIADSGNGLSYVLPLDGSWYFINPDLTVHFQREPVGAWVCLDARTDLDAAGFGLASSRLYDATGLVARGAQALYIGPR